MLAGPVPPREIRGIEIQPAHCRAAEELPGAARRPRDAGDGHPGGPLRARPRAGRDAGASAGPLLVVGNPPWVTSAELGSLNSASVPPKSNVKRLSGLEARTGSSNFDVAEAVWLKLARELAAESPTIAILCKTSVARGILQFAHRAGLPVVDASIRRIDAARWFGAAVDACLFCARSPGSDPARGTAVAAAATIGVPVYRALDAAEPDGTLGFARGWLVAGSRDVRSLCVRRRRVPADLAAGAQARRRGGDGAERRTPASGRLRNGAGEVGRRRGRIRLSADQGGRPDAGRPASGPAERCWSPSSGSATTPSGWRRPAPRLWSLPAMPTPSGSIGAGRRSTAAGPRSASSASGRTASPRSRWRSPGMHKAPAFRAVGPRDGRPVMLDDTCYFLPCSTAAGGRRR